MATEKGFTIELSSRYEGWWRYNATLMCGCFDVQDQRIGFASAQSHIAEPGTNLHKKPAEVDPARTLTLETPLCDHLILYLYIVPHTLPAGNDIEASQPFDIQLTISYNGKKLRTEQRAINQWSGASIELKIPTTPANCAD